MKILLLAFQNNNFGDDLMIRLLCSSFPEHTFEINSKGEQYFKNFSDIKNLKITSYTLKQLSTMKPCPYKAIVKIGGSLFQIMKRGSMKNHFIEAGYVKKIRKNGCAFATIGCNVGPFLNKFAKLIGAAELKQNDLITVRDKASMAFLDKYAKSTNRRYFPDILFSLNISPSDEHKSGMSVSVYGEKRINTDNYRKKIAEAVQLFRSQTGEKVNLLCFEDDDTSDIATAKEIKRLCGNDDGINIIVHNGDGSEIIKSVQQSRFVIATRFHSLVISMLCSTPVAPVIYSNKTENLLDDISFKGSRIYLQQLENTDPQQLLQPTKLECADLREGAKGHIAALKELLCGISGGTDE